MSDVLVRSSGDEVIQSFPLSKGNVNKESGTYQGVSIAHCVADGNFTITWNDGSDSTAIVCSEGDDYTIMDAKSITIVAGTFHIA